jgi:hypothetical protein
MHFDFAIDNSYLNNQNSHIYIYIYVCYITCSIDQQSLHCKYAKFKILILQCIFALSFIYSVFLMLLYLHSRLFNGNRTVQRKCDD